MLGEGRIRNLVFKGGSVKGIAYVGVQAALEACDFPLAQVERVGGTSAGAMNALGFALGLSLEETKRHFLSLDFKDLLDDAQASVSREQLLGAHNAKTSFFKAAAVSSVASSALPELKGRLGLYPGEFVRELMEALIFDKTKIRHCTFAELHQLRTTTHPRFKDLYVVGFNLNTQVAHTFSFETTPDVIISDAIRISMSIPFLFQPHAPYRKVSGERVKDSTTHYWIDGGVAENYPVTLFDKQRYISGTQSIPPDEDVYNTETLGFFLTEGAQFEYLAHGTAASALPDRSIHGLLDYTKAVLSSITGGEYNEHIRRNERRRTIYINHGDIGLLDFNLTPAQIQQLLRAGWDSVRKAYPRELAFPANLAPAEAAEPSTQSSRGFFTGAHRRDGTTQITQTVMRALISDAYLLDHDTWVLAMVRKKKTEHAHLLIEGVVSGERVVFRSDLFLDIKNRPKIVDALGSMLPTASAVDHLWGASASLGHGTAFVRLAELHADEYDRLMDRVHNEYQSWDITKDEADALFQRLIVEADKPFIAYHIGGDHPSWSVSASRSEYHNCVSWCQQILRDVIPRLSIGDRWATFVKRPSEVIAQLQRQAAAAPAI